MLTLHQVSKVFNAGTVNAHRALDEVSLDLPDGSFTVVVGGNGSGKSTLLNAVAGVFPVDAGSITLDGRDITHLPEHRRAADIGRVFQDPMAGTAAHMTIEENLALAARRGRRRGLRAGLTARERAEFRARIARLGLGLEERMTTRMGLLSGGQRQAVTLLMATMRRPKVLLLDEHTAALDPRTAAKVLDVSDRIVRQSGLTTLMITHNMADAIGYGDRLLMMAEGRIVFEARGDAKAALTPADLLTRFSQAIAL